MKKRRKPKNTKKGNIYDICTYTRAGANYKVKY